MNNENKTTYSYKEDIINTRVGCLGGSDARMLAQVDINGQVPKSAYKRLAICKGLAAQEEITNRAMEYGDFIENKIFESLASNDKRYESNPCWVSEKYSRKNVKCIDHVDIVLRDEAKKVLYVWEVKTSKHNFEVVRQDYKAQLYHHYLLAQEKISKEEKPREWRVKINLVHYDTSGLDLDAPFMFEPQRITIKEVKFIHKVFDLARAMDLVDEFLDDFDFYSENEVVASNMLPEKIQEQFMQIADVMRNIKAQEERVEQFKQKLYDFMVEKGIKGVSGDDYTFTVVLPTKQVSFDAKAYMADFEAKHPTKAKRIREQYKKEVNKKGYLTIKVKPKSEQ